MRKFSLGLDFGTESLRGILVDVADGNELATEVFDYPDGVISEKLPIPKGAGLDSDWYLQNPADYLTALDNVIPALMKGTGVKPEQVVGIGIDFTACTLLAATQDAVPLCMVPEFRSNPNAWAKLWKHHGAMSQADRVTEIAHQRQEKWLEYYSGTVSSEWLISKAFEMLEEAPELYHCAHTLVEGADWIVWQLTGRLIRNSCCAGYKGQYVHELGGWPSRDFLGAVNPELAGLFEEKVLGDVLPAGAEAGQLTEQWAARLHLKAGTPVSAGIIDAHAGVPGCGVTGPGSLVAVLGTSFCYELLAEKFVPFEGVLGAVKDGIISGFYAYETSQAAGGDNFAWFVQNCVPGRYFQQALDKKVNIHDVLSAEASELKPGENGLIALDWLNGNRSVLMNHRLSGLIVGLTLGTRTEEIYRAFAESLAYGALTIIEAHEAAGLEINEIVACGGLADRNPFFMQVLCNVCSRPIQVAASEQTVALGSAIFGAVAAGKAGGGHDTIDSAVKAMVKPPKTTYRPDRSVQETYGRLYREYKVLHDYFGRSEKVMERLRSL